MSDCLDLGFHELMRPGDWIYRWIDDENVVDGDIIGAHWPTSQWKRGLSCDWGILTRPDQTALRLGGSLPAYVLRFKIAVCTRLQIEVRHCPVVDEASPDYNLAHRLLFPHDASKSAIRKVRSELQDPSRSELLRVQPSTLHQLFAYLRRWHPRHRAAMRLIKHSTTRR